MASGSAATAAGTRSCPGCGNVSLAGRANCQWCGLVFGDRIAAEDWRLTTRVPRRARVAVICAYLIVAAALLGAHPVAKALTASLIGAAAGIALAMLLVHIAATISGRAAREAMARRQQFADRHHAGELDCPDGFALYLRPFSLDGRAVQARWQGPLAMVVYVGFIGMVLTHPLVGIVLYLMSALGSGARRELEEDLANALATHVPLFALGNEPSVGAMKLGTPDSEWLARFRELAGRARAIIMVPGASEGSLLEIGEMQRFGWLNKTLVICPAALIAPDDPASKSGNPFPSPATRANAKAHWEKTSAAISARYSLNLPDYSPGCVFAIDSTGGFERIARVRGLSTHDGAAAALAALTARRQREVRHGTNAPRDSDEDIG